MNNPYVTLTATDKIIMESYKTCVDGLAEYLGDGYEIVLHSLESLDRSAIKVINGHYTGRSEGAPITDLALRMLEKIRKSNDYRAVSYFNRNKNGALLKSTTIPILGEQGQIIGLLCINFHTEISLSDILAALVPSQSQPSSMTETFAENVDDLLVSALAEAKNKVLMNPTISASNKNKEIIALLYEKGVFHLKDAVIRVAQMLDISKNTVYLHLRNLERQQKEL